MLGGISFLRSMRLIFAQVSAEGRFPPGRVSRNLLAKGGSLALPGSEVARCSSDIQMNSVPWLKGTVHGLVAALKLALPEL